MRNLSRHPITTAEIEGCLRKLADEIAAERPLRMGDMRPLLLTKAAVIVARAGYVVHDVLVDDSIAERSVG